MTDLHIDDFFKDSALILARLFSVFPRKSTMYVEDVSGPDSADEFGLHSERHLSCLSTMIWLSEEGYIRFNDTIRQEAIDEAVLTHRAFTLLCSRSDIEFEKAENRSQNLNNLPASVLAEHHTNISQLKQAIKNRDSNQIRHIMHQLMLTFLNT
jgi:hypothetical protein